LGGGGFSTTPSFPKKTREGTVEALSAVTLVGCENWGAGAGREKKDLFRLSKSLSEVGEGGNKFAVATGAPPEVLFKGLVGAADVV